MDLVDSLRIALQGGTTAASMIELREPLISSGIHNKHELN